MAKKKLALLISYTGTGYSGLQYLKDIKTLEGEIIKALSTYGAITELNSEDPNKKIGLQRCCRTDKGVHAILNVLVVKVIKDLDLDELNPLLPQNIKILKAIRVGKSFVAKNRCDGRIYEYLVPKTEIKDKIEEFKDFVKNYVGVKNYHNFTASSIDIGKMRNITDVEVTEYEEFVIFRIKGQSFMLHQIRKMVGFAILCIRKGFDFEKSLTKAFSEEKFNIPKAPSQFLLLERPIFDFYNKKYEETHEPLKIDEEVIEERKKIIYKEVLKELKEEHFKYWNEAIDEHFDEFEHFLN